MSAAPPLTKPRPKNISSSIGIRPGFCGHETGKIYNDNLNKEKEGPAQGRCRSSCVPSPIRYDESTVRSVRNLGYESTACAKWILVDRTCKRFDSFLDVRADVLEQKYRNGFSYGPQSVLSIEDVTVVEACWGQRSVPTDVSQTQHVEEAEISLSTLALNRHFH